MYVCIHNTSTYVCVCTENVVVAVVVVVVET